MVGNEPLACDIIKHMQNNELKKYEEHYVCLGGCRGGSKVPGVCQAPDCANHNHELVKCNCTNGLHYNFNPAKFNK